MHDVATAERAGVPSTAILSDAFGSQGLFQADGLGLEAAAAERLIVLAEHPISDATDAELRAKAERLFPDLVRSLTRDGPPDAALLGKLRGAAPQRGGGCGAGG